MLSSAVGRAAIGPAQRSAPPRPKRDSRATVPSVRGVFRATASLGALWAGAALMGVAAFASLSVDVVCVSYAAGTGPHHGSGCSRADAGFVWGTTLLSGLAVG